MAAIREQLEGQFQPMPLPPGTRRRPPLWDARSVEPSKIFKALATLTRRVGAWMLNQLYLALPNPDQNWDGDCLTDNFHTRLWEADLLASFREHGLLVEQDYQSPDFHISNGRGDETWIEAVTANPIDRYEHYGTEPVDPPQARRDRVLGTSGQTG